MTEIPLIINFVPTGMIPTKAMTPHVPVEASEIVDQTLEAAELGASIVHLHARDADERPTYQKEAYAPILEGIRRDNADIILCVTTSGRDHKEFWQRSQVLELDGDARPEMASLTLGSLNFARTASCNAPDMIQQLLAKMTDNHVMPELEVFEIGMINFAHYLITKGLLRPPYHFNLLFGNLFSAQSDLLSIGHLLSVLPPQSTVALAGLGNAQNVATATAVVNGLHARIGLEDNIFYDEDRKVRATNRMLVERVVNLAHAVGRSVATPAEARRMIGLPSRAAQSPSLASA